MAAFCKSDTFTVNKLSPHKIQRLLLLSRFSRVRLCATPETAAHQAPPSLGFSRQEHWSGLPFPSPMRESEKWKWSCSVVSDSLRPHGLHPPGSSVYGIFQARVLEWGAIAFSNKDHTYTYIHYTITRNTGTLHTAVKFRRTENLWLTRQQLTTIWVTGGGEKGRPRRKAGRPELRRIHQQLKPTRHSTNNHQPTGKCRQEVRHLQTKGCSPNSPQVHVWDTVDPAASELRKTRNSHFIHPSIMTMHTAENVSPNKTKINSPASTLKGPLWLLLWN